MGRPVGAGLAAAKLKKGTDMNYELRPYVKRAVLTRTPVCIGEFTEREVKLINENLTGFVWELIEDKQLEQIVAEIFRSRRLT